MSLPAENLLSGETSPYLLQHSGNPVHWRPWSPAALEEARRLDRPILLSVGYAACHWCHVMAHESFEDETVAAQMNRLFVNIKVDREERPDIDQIYMAALGAMGEQGGWPLTMFLTPEGEPFWGGTYFPREPRYGRPGIVQILEAVGRTWREKRPELTHSARTLSQHVAGRLSIAAAPAALGGEALAALARSIGAMIDREHGGLSGAPKFPNAPFMQVLWLDWLENGSAAHRDAVLLSLKKMLAGGIYDHVGGGLARYSTDAFWLVPHFEKMLYDNAQLIRLANWAFAESGDELFRLRIEETVAWLLRDMRADDGAFASSFDADSEGEEGKFYLWTEDEIEKALGPETDAFRETFSLASPQGWEGAPILHRGTAPDHLGDEGEARLRAALDSLRQAREKRVPPHRDDKVLVDWNGLAIAALAEAGRALQRPEWVDAAAAAYRSIAGSMWDGRLPHSIRGDRRLFPCLATDYAAMINAAAALYQATWKRAYIDDARHWLDTLAAWHGDGEGTGFFLTASDSGDVPMRIRGDTDEALPSATAQIIEAMVRLSSLDGDSALYERAVAVAEAAMGRIADQPYGQAGIVHACGLAMQPVKLVLSGPADSELVSVANRSPDPRRVDILASRQDAGRLLPAGTDIEGDGPAAWLCTGQTCLPPIRDAAALRDALTREAERA